MKVIFLDIDGVLNTPETWGAWARLGYPESLERQLVMRLAALVKNSESKCVLSSTWRLSSAGLSGTIACLAMRGWPDASQYVIGETPRLPGRPRGEEISAWLKGRSDVESFVILDDATDMGELSSRLVNTDYRQGLQNADVERALDLLMGA